MFKFIESVIRYEVTAHLHVFYNVHINVWWEFQRNPGVPNMRQSNVVNSCGEVREPLENEPGQSRQKAKDTTMMIFTFFVCMLFYFP